MDAISEKKDIVNYFLGKGILLSSDIFDSVTISNIENIHALIAEKIKSDDFLLLNQDLKKALFDLPSVDINWFDLERSRVALEKGKGAKVYEEFLNYLSEAPQTEEHSDIEILTTHSEDSKKRDVQDFVAYFNSRYKSMEKILSSRPELQYLTSITRATSKREREQVSIIGLVSEKAMTKNGNIMLTLEDPTGLIKVLINKNKPEVFDECTSIVDDEIIAISGVTGDNIIFANKVVWPELQYKELKKGPKESYAVFLSDLHVGSNMFLPDAFNKFLRWIRGEVGNEDQKNIASKIDYLFVIGDSVDGVGIYPGQDEELTIPDIYDQYTEVARLLSQIPSRIKIIICPGNHDAMRIAEPQPPLYQDFAKALYELPNVIHVSNPALVRIGIDENFSGFDVLMYHGYSFDHYVANVDSIRNNGGYDRADLIMRFLLKRRHLAPTHTSTLYVPTVDEDPLVITKVPDFFVTGHIHKSVAANYKNVTLISGSCWQAKTAFQEKVGHNPEPGRVPLVNLQTREIKIMKFL